MHHELVLNLAPSMPTENAMEIGMAHVFLMEGFNEAHRDRSDLAEELYEQHSRLHGGYVGIVDDMWLKAAVLVGALEMYEDDAGDDIDYPGVFEYEVTEGLGKWCFNNPNATIEDFTNVAISRVNEWFEDAQNDPANLPVCRCDLCRAFGDNSPSPTLNAAQPVAVEEEVSTTMKIQDLIDHLETALDDHGNVDVVIRGSKPTTFVDATEVRTIKTSKRRAVFIGKAATQPQE